MTRVGDGQLPQVSLPGNRAGVAPTGSWGAELPMSC